MRSAIAVIFLQGLETQAILTDQPPETGQKTPGVFEIKRRSADSVLPQAEAEHPPGALGGSGQAWGGAGPCNLAALVPILRP